MPEKNEYRQFESIYAYMIINYTEMSSIGLYNDKGLPSRFVNTVSSKAIGIRKRHTFSSVTNHL